MTTSSLDRNEKPLAGYDHARLERTRTFLRFLLRYPGWLLMRVNRIDGLENLPTKGPGIIMINHIAWVDPMVVIHASPRHPVPLGKIEAWSYPVFGIVPDMWGAIPVQREAVDSKTLRQARDVLTSGELLLVAPEGTRNDSLQRGLEGIAYLGSRSGAPIIPVTLENTEGYPTIPFSRRWWQTGAQVRFGRPFRYRPEYKRARREELRLMTDEAMYILAGMLPPNRRGVYADVDQVNFKTIERL